jgi:hypothetical protein
MRTPRFTISLQTGKALMDIESARQAVADLRLPSPVLERLKRQARVSVAHCSTRSTGRVIPNACVTRAKR